MLLPTLLVTALRLVAAVPMPAQGSRSLQGCVCTDEYAPVCDGQGHRYANECWAACQRVTDAAPCQEVNCCGGGSACGWTHCATLGDDPSTACVQPWRMPPGLLWPTSCQQDATKGCLRDSRGRCVPADCAQWYDGCNQCRVQDGALQCTRMACRTQRAPACVAHHR